MAKVADVQEMRAIFIPYWRAGRKIDHQWAPVQQVARNSELLDQQFDFHFGNHQRQITTIKRGDFALGQIGIGHVFKLFTRRRGEQAAEVIVVLAGLQALLEALMPTLPEALQVATFQHAQRIGTILLDPPTELFLHHELIEQHDVRRQFTDEGVKTAVVQLDGDFTNTQCRQVCALFAETCRAAEGDLPALLQENLENLHDMPAGRGRAGLGPDVTNDQDFGCAGLNHVRNFLEAKTGQGRKRRALNHSGSPGHPRMPLTLSRN
ncbi:hypothetical protein D9M71_214050 [compost metagenome]